MGGATSGALGTFLPSAVGVEQPVDGVGAGVRVGGGGQVCIDPGITGEIVWPRAKSVHLVWSPVGSIPIGLRNDPSPPEAEKGKVRERLEEAGGEFVEYAAPRSPSITASGGKVGAGMPI